MVRFKVFIIIRIWASWQPLMFTTISLNDTHINFWWHGDIHIMKNQTNQSLKGRFIWIHIWLWKKEEKLWENITWFLSFTWLYLKDTKVKHNKVVILPGGILWMKQWINIIIVLFLWWNIKKKKRLLLPHTTNWFDCDDSLCVWKVPRKKEFKIHDTVADPCCEI